MRRTYLYFGLIVAVFTTAGVVWWHRTGEAQQPRPVAPAAAVPKPTLPLTQVVLFTSGVGYFHREGTVDGDARVDLTVATKDVNDLLKSLVLEDHGGGKCSAVNYDSQEPAENTLRSFAIDLTDGPNFAELLTQARGEKVEVKTQGVPAVPGTISGSVVGVEEQLDATKKIFFLNILTTDGVRTLPLASVQSFRFLNPALDVDFRTALDVLAKSHDTQKKQVSFHFVGEGKRDVRVGYIAESPMWKANYRLVFGKDGKLRLQAWAVVENTTDEDWKDVRVTLVSARPISFKMDQYQPLFVPRPTVEPELFALLRPPVFAGAIVDGNFPRGGQFGQFGGQFGGGQFGGGPMPQPRGRSDRGTTVQIDPTTGLPVTPPSSPPPTALTFQELQDRRRVAKQEREKARQLGNTVAALDLKDIADGLPAREGGELEESFQYVIDQKVSIARQKSALIPILDEEIKGQRVSLVNERNESNLPLLGLRIQNTTDKPLLQGPAMVFDGGRYAGDARLADLRRGDERYLAYAVDLGLEAKVVDPEGVRTFIKETPGAMADVMGEGSVIARWPTSVKMVRGDLRIHRKEQATKEYQLKTRSREDRTVIIEHPRDNAWKLVSPQPLEMSADFYRFQVPVAVGKPVRFTLVRERTTEETLAVPSLTRDTLRFYLEGPLTSPAIKEAVRKVLERYASLQAFDEEHAELDGQLRIIVEDQARLRANIERVPKDAEVYKRYLNKFDTQETQIEKLQAQVKEKAKVVKQKRKDYADYLEGVNVD